MKLAFNRVENLKLEIMICFTAKFLHWFAIFMIFFDTGVNTGI